MIFGYARVSTEDQNLALQMDALSIANCDRIYSDYAYSGASIIRPGLQQLFLDMTRGDTLIVWKLDRLGRSAKQLIILLERLNSKDIHFQSITENIDTRTSSGRLVFHMMAAFAEFERNLISERTKAGIVAARAAGKNIGRPRLLNIHQIKKAHHLLNSNESNKEQIAKNFGVNIRTLNRALLR